MLAVVFESRRLPRSEAAGATHGVRNGEAPRGASSCAPSIDRVDPGERRGVPEKDAFREGYLSREEAEETPAGHRKGNLTGAFFVTFLAAIGQGSSFRPAHFVLTRRMRAAPCCSSSRSRTHSRASSSSAVLVSQGGSAAANPTHHSIRRCNVSLRLIGITVLVMRRAPTIDVCRVSRCVPVAMRRTF